MSTTKFLGKGCIIALLLAMAVVVGFSVQSCKNNRQLTETNSKYEEQIDSLVAVADQWTKDYEAAEKNHLIAKSQYEGKIANLNSEIQKTKMLYNDKVKEVKNYQDTAIRAIFLDRYEVELEPEFLLPVEAGREAITDLYKMDMYKDMTESQDSIIKVQTEYIATADSALLITGANVIQLESDLRDMAENYTQSEAVREQLDDKLSTSHTWNIALGAMTGVSIVGLFLSLIFGGR